MAGQSGTRLDGLRTQVQMHSHIAVRDLPKRIVSVQFLLFAIWASGQEKLALVNLALLLVLETLIFLNTRTMPKVTQVSFGRIALVLGLSGSVSLCYYMPGVVLAANPDFGLAAGGLIWIMAALSTNLVMYNALRVLFWTTALAGFPAALIAVSFVAGNDITPATGYTWLLPVSIVCMHLVNMLQQLWEYRDTHRELEQTRADLLSSLRKMEHMSLHDGLTGLGNRSAFNQLLDIMLARVEQGQVLGVFMLDLNGFKPINDTYGHAAGDAVLKAVADRLRKALVPGAQAFRLGGDEFAVLSYAADRQSLQKFGDRLAQAIRASIQHDGRALLVGGSIGVSAAETAQMAAGTLCAIADQAMYDAKAARMQTALIGDPDAVGAGIDAGQQAALEQALRQNEISPYYQPKYTSDGTGFVGLQALARWHRDDGLIAAEAFLPDMDRFGLLPDLTLCILRQVLRDMDAWRAQGMAMGRVSVNMPVTSLATDSRREELEWLLAEYPGLEDALAFEITEEAYTARAGDAVAVTLRQFSALGIEIYLDDFGTGHGSYQHLRQFTPDEIKIDASLVADMASDPAAALVIQGVINLAHGVGAKVVAEGVETEMQRIQLWTLGCDFVEGYHFAEPLPADQTVQLLRREEVRAALG